MYYLLYTRCPSLKGRVRTVGVHQLALGQGDDGVLHGVAVVRHHRVLVALGDDHHALVRAGGLGQRRQLERDLRDVVGAEARGGGEGARLGLVGEEVVDVRQRLLQQREQAGDLRGREGGGGGGGERRLRRRPRVIGQQPSSLYVIFLGCHRGHPSSPFPLPRPSPPRAWQMKGAEMFIMRNLNLAAECSAMAMMDSGETVRKKPEM